MKTLLLLLSAGVVLSAADVTFSETIAPIVYQNCVTCHRPGEAAPFSLISYDDVKKRGALIATVTKSRYMPPWHAEHGYGEFADERRLTDQQITTIGEWVKQGMPQGDPAKMPKLPQFTDGWHLGKPDLILEMPASYEVPASGPDIYRNFAIPINLTEDKWVRAVEFRPGARKAVHHALIAYVRAGAVANMDGKDGKPGFSGMQGLGLGIAPNMAPSGGLGGWAVGTTPVFLPDGQAIPLAKGTDLIINMHFHPTGKVESERATVGIYFADKAPEVTMFGGGLPYLFGIGSGLDIPPGEKNYTIKDSMTLPVDVKLFGAAAHAHYLGKEMKATATLPDGRTQPLLWIKDWDFNWQEQYNYKDPVLLPKGTRIDVSISYDNSADNPRNPTNPPKRVQWGEQSFDEMGGIGLNMVTLRKEDEAALSKSFGDGTTAAIAKALADGTIRRFLAAETVARVNAAPAPQLQRITVFDREGKILSTLGEPGLFTQPTLSPDGMRVAAIKTDTTSGNRNVWVFDIASGKGTPVTSGARPNMSPVWSPDGKQIAYVSILDKEIYAITRKASDGSGSEELIYKHTTPGAAMVLTDWSSDGRICFWSGKITYAVSAGGGQKPVELFNEAYDVRGGRFSPDNRFLAYNSNGSGKFQTYVGPLNPVAKGLQISTDPAAGGIFWREDAKELYFLSLPPDQSMMAVDITTTPTFQAGTPRLLFKLPSPIGTPAQLSSVASRDGQRFVFIVQTSAGAPSR
jgi:hypothetical protein